MTLRSYRPRTLRARAFLVVLLGALTPLGIGLWQALGAGRAGEALLRSQLSESLLRVDAEIRDRWRYREGDLILLSANDPVRRAMSGEPAEEAIRFVSELLPRMRGVRGVVFLDAQERVHWSAGTVPDEIGASPGPEGRVAEQQLEVALPVPDTSGAPVGSMRAWIDLSSLIQGAAVPSAAGGATLALLGHEGESVGDAVDPALFRLPRFEHEGTRWITERRKVDGVPLELSLAAPLDPFVLPFERTAIRSAAALLVGTALTLVLAGFLTGRLTASLREVSRAAAAVAAGDLERRVPEAGAEEVSGVARAFNEMTVGLRRTLALLSEREALATLGEFAATLAHEVRNPLTAIRIDLQRLSRRYVDDSTAREALQRALHQVERLDRTVQGTLRVAASGRVGVQEVDLMRVLVAAAEAARPQVEAKGGVLEVGAAREPTVVRGDPAALEQLLLNLLLNAADALPADGSGRIDASVESNGAPRVVVRDNGRGMSMEDLQKARQPFFTTRAGGTGLGLTISERIARAHGGALRMESEPGAGTRVVVELPQPWERDGWTQLDR
jgi:signal transduction histidine kinase